MCNHGGRANQESIPSLAERNLTPDSAIEDCAIEEKGLVQVHKSVMITQPLVGGLRNVIGLEFRVLALWSLVISALVCRPKWILYFLMFHQSWPWLMIRTLESRLLQQMLKLVPNWIFFDRNLGWWWLPRLANRFMLGWSIRTVSFP